MEQVLWFKAEIEICAAQLDLLYLTDTDTRQCLPWHVPSERVFNSSSMFVHLLHNSSTTPWVFMVVSDSTTIHMLVPSSGCTARAILWPDNLDLVLETDILCTEIACT